MEAEKAMEVLVVILAGSVHVALARAAVRQRWTVLALDNAVEAMREIRDRCPRLVVLQVSIFNNEPLRLIRMLRHSSQQVLLVAVAKDHRAQLERMVRDAGASCYLPSAEEEEPLIQAVNSMLEYTPVPAGADEASSMLVSFDPQPPFAGHGKRGAHR